MLKCLAGYYSGLLTKHNREQAGRELICPQRGERQYSGGGEGEERKELEG